MNTASPTLVLTVMPDYGGAYLWRKQAIDSAHRGVGANVDGRHLGLQEGEQLPEDLISDLESWQSAFASFDYAQTYGWLAFDWVGYHRRGIALAARIKGIVGGAATVIYEKPFEDPCHHDAEQREVFADGSYKILPPKPTQGVANR